MTKLSVDQYVIAVKALLTENDDEALLPEVAAALTRVAIDKADEPVIISATPLSDEQQAQLKAVLESDSITFKVDPEIGGGLIVEENGRRTDLSLKHRLHD